MSRIIVELKDNEEFQSLELYLKQRGILFKTEEEEKLEKQKTLVSEFAAMLSETRDVNVTDEEIDGIINEVRDNRYETNRS